MQDIVYWLLAKDLVEKSRWIITVAAAVGYYVCLTNVVVVKT